MNDGSDARSSWEARLGELSRAPRRVEDARALTIVLPASAQVATPQREFLLTTPSEGVSLVATVARDAGWDVEVVDMRLGVTAETAAARAIVRGGLVAMPTFVDSLPHNEAVLGLVRREAPALPIVIGGALVSSLPETIVAHLPCDAAVVGEGELTWLELLEHLAAGRKIGDLGAMAGLVVRAADGTIRHNERRPQIEDLDVLPVPRLDLFSATRQTPTIPKLGVTTARGCYGRCAFCFVNIRKLRWKSAPRVGAELRELIRRHGVEYFYINDLTFTAQRDRTLAVLDEIGPLGVAWSCSTRVERCDAELLRRMREAGCIDIWYGIESLDQEVLDLCQKQQTVEEIEQAVALTREAGINVMTNFIVGLPGESVSSLDKMLRFIETSDSIPASIKYLTPFPGTPIYDEARRRGVIGDHLDYLGRLAARRVNDAEDEIFNITDLPDQVLRDYYRRLEELRARRVDEFYRRGQATPRPSC